MFEFLNEYNISFHYQLDKANIVVDAIRRLYIGSLAHVNKGKQELVKDIHYSGNLGVQLFDYKDGGVIVQEEVRSCLVQKSRRSK